MLAEMEQAKNKSNEAVATYDPIVNILKELHLKFK